MTFQFHQHKQDHNIPQCTHGILNLLMITPSVLHTPGVLNRHYALRNVHRVKIHRSTQNFHPLGNYTLALRKIDQQNSLFLQFLHSTQMLPKWCHKMMNRKSAKQLHDFRSQVPVCLVNYENLPCLGFDRIYGKSPLCI